MFKFPSVDWGDQPQKPTDLKQYELKRQEFKEKIIKVFDEKTGVLDLSGDKLSNHYIETIFENLPSGTKHLILKNCGIEVEEAIALRYILSGNTSLKSVNISDNTIATEGAKHIAEVLKVNKSLQSVNISRNRIETEGAKHIAEALKLNTSLKSVDISSTGILPEGAKHIAEALKVNTSLQSVNISCNVISLQGAINIAEALKLNTSLKSLNISRNIIGPDGSYAIVKGVQVHKTLKDLDMSGNLPGPNAFLSFVSEDTGIERLDLRGIVTSKEKIQEITVALKGNTSIARIFLDESFKSRPAEAFVREIEICNYTLQDITFCSTSGSVVKISSDRNKKLAKFKNLFASIPKETIFGGVIFFKQMEFLLKHSNETLDKSLLRLPMISDEMIKYPKKIADKYWPKFNYIEDIFMHLRIFNTSTTMGEQRTKRDNNELKIYDLPLDVIRKILTYVCPYLAKEIYEVNFVPTESDTKPNVVEVSGEESDTKPNVVEVSGEESKIEEVFE